MRPIFSPTSPHYEPPRGGFGYSHAVQYGGGYYQAPK